MAAVCLPGRPCHTDDMHGRGRPGRAVAGRVVAGRGAGLGLAAVAGAAMVVVAIMPAAAGAVPPGRAVAAALAAGAAQPSVHWVAIADTKGITTTLNTHAGRASGWQTVSETASTGSAALTIELVKGALFMTGSAGGLYLQGLTEKAATAEAGKWVSVPASSPIYASVAAGLTTKSTMQEFVMAGTVTKVAPARVSGHLDPGYRGKTKAAKGQPAQAETVYVTASSPYLPAKVVSGGATTLFSQWGSAVNVTRPSGAVPLKAVWLQHR
jgi:hypothetical protein